MPASDHTAPNGNAQSSPRTLYRQMIAAPEIVVMPVISDPLTALLAQDLGFRAVNLGGFALGAHLGTTEPLLCVEDVAAAARYITAVCQLPLMIDAGAGWGEPMHVGHTIKVLEATGASSVHIEDQAYPKRAHYHKGIEHTISMEEMIPKIRAAVAARRDPAFSIVARTDAMATDGYGEGIRRARAYMEAGADMIMLFPNSLAEAKSAPRDLPGVPLVFVHSDGNHLGRPLCPYSDLEKWGWACVSYPTTVAIATVRSVGDVLKTLLATGTPGTEHDENESYRTQIERLIGLPEYYRLEAETVEGQEIQVAPHAGRGR